MSWLKDNPLAMVLASVSGLLLLITVALGYVWSRPASSGAAAPVINGTGSGEAQKLMSDLGPVSNYREVTERPVFDESRRPRVALDDENGGLDEEGLSTTVADAPEVRLTGVVITPEISMVTLTPLAGGASFVAVEGKQLEGEYTGWSVVDVEPRRIVLASLDGGEMEIDLQVNNREIMEPPKLEPADPAALAGTQDQPVAGSGEDQPLSRAEEIRQRIAERREELRRQAEQQGDADADPGANSPSAYQSAIQNMLKRKDAKNEEQERGGDDGSER